MTITLSGLISMTSKKTQRTPTKENRPADGTEARKGGLFPQGTALKNQHRYGKVSQVKEQALKKRSNAMKTSSFGELWSSKCRASFLKMLLKMK